MLVKLLLGSFQVPNGRLVHDLLLLLGSFGLQKQSRKTRLGAAPNGHSQWRVGDLLVGGPLGSQNVDPLPMWRTCQCGGLARKSVCGTVSW